MCGELINLIIVSGTPILLKEHLKLQYLLDLDRGDCVQNCSRNVGDSDE